MGIDIKPVAIYQTVMAELCAFLLAVIVEILFVGVTADLGRPEEYLPPFALRARTCSSLPLVHLAQADTNTRSPAIIGFPRRVHSFNSAAVSLLKIGFPVANSRETISNLALPGCPRN